MPELINWAIIKEPINWAIVLLMLALAAFGLCIVFGPQSQPQPQPGLAVF